MRVRAIPLSFLREVFFQCPPDCRRCQWLHLELASRRRGALCLLITSVRILLFYLRSIQGTRSSLYSFAEFDKVFRLLTRKCIETYICHSNNVDMLTLLPTFSMLSCTIGKMVTFWLYCLPLLVYDPVSSLLNRLLRLFTAGLWLGCGRVGLGQWLANGWVGLGNLLSLSSFSSSSLLTSSSSFSYGSSHWKVWNPFCLISHHVTLWLCHDCFVWFACSLCERILLHFYLLLHITTLESFIIPFII